MCMLNEYSIFQIDSTILDQHLAATLTEMLCQCKQPSTLGMHSGEKPVSPTESLDNSNTPSRRDQGESRDVN